MLEKIFSSKDKDKSKTLKEKIWRPQKPKGTSDEKIRF